MKPVFSYFFGIILSVGLMACEQSDKQAGPSKVDAAVKKTEKQAAVKTKPQLVIEGLSPYQKISGKLSIQPKLTGKGSIKQVALYKGFTEKAAVTSNTPPFTLEWDASSDQDALLEVIIKAELSDNSSVSTENIPVIIFNNGKAAKVTPSSKGTIKVPADFTAERHLHIRHPWKPEQGFKKAIAILSWEQSNSPAWEFELTLGKGHCPHSGKVLPGAKKAASKSPIVIEVEPLKDFLPDAPYFAHIDAMNAGEHKGETIDYSLNIYTLH